LESSLVGQTSRIEGDGTKATKEEVENSITAHGIIGRSILRQTNKDIETLERAIGVLNGQIWLYQDDEEHKSALVKMSVLLAHIIRQMEDGKARDIQGINRDIEDAIKNNGLVKSGILYTQ
jgi:uncharacterized protein (UPF0254 family)